MFNVKLNTSLSDIAKFVAISCILLLLVFKGDYYIDKFKTGPTIDHTTIEHIAENVVKVNLAENNAELKALIQKLKLDKSKALEEAQQANLNIKELGVVLAKLKSSLDEQNSDIHTDPIPSRTFDNTIVYREDEVGNKIPFSRVFYHPDYPTEDRWFIQNYPIDFKANIISGTDINGNENRYLEVWMENNVFGPSVAGKKFPVRLSEVNWAKGEEPNKRFMWNPRLGIGVGLSNLDIYPGLDLSLFSYGRTKRDMDWRFLNTFLGGNSDDVSLGITPIQYNLGNNIDMIENLFIGPGVFYNSNSKLGFGFTISVPF